MREHDNACVWHKQIKQKISPQCGNCASTVETQGFKWFGYYVVCVAGQILLITISTRLFVAQTEHISSLTGTKLILSCSEMYLLCFTVHELFYIAFILRTMEKGSPSQPPADSTQDSCPVQNGASQPSPTRAPAWFIPDVSKSTQSLTSTDLQRLSSSSQCSTHSSSPQSDSSLAGSPFPSQHPIFETEFTEDSKLEVSSDECSPNQIPSFSHQSAADFSCSRLADSSCASSTSAMASASTSISPKKRSFASMAKLVILQEKLRKAQESDSNDEDEGEGSFYLASGVSVESACFSRVRGGGGGDYIFFNK